MKNMKTLFAGLALGAVMAALPSLSQAAGIIGTKHDFSTNTWNSGTSGTNSPGRKGACNVCHTAHHTDPSQIAPLWAHATSQAVFTMYDSPWLTNKNITVDAQPSGASLACLSCHDGVTAVNQKYSGAYISGVSAGSIAEAGVIGTDLHTTHPISVEYNTAKDQFLYEPSTALSTFQWWNAAWKFSSANPTIGNSLLIGGKVECASCHDIHAQKGNAGSSGIYTKIGGYDTAGRGSTLCRTCHNK